MVAEPNAPAFRQRPRPNNQVYAQRYHEAMDQQFRRLREQVENGIITQERYAEVLQEMENAHERKCDRAMEQMRRNLERMRRRLDEQRVMNQMNELNIDNNQ